jgi:hypothetical protein
MMAARRRRAGAPAAVARKAKAMPHMRSRDASLERQAEWATQLALRGNVNVARVLTPAPAAHVDAPASTGTALPATARAEAETAFGADLSEVRVHHDPTSWSLAEREDAHAFTAGRDIYFGERRLDPGGEQGRALLFHELAHVLQQTGRRMSTTLIRATDASGAAPFQARGGKRHG